MNRAKDTVIGDIIDAQSLNVQTVSGATMSSNGIIEAVANALGIAYTNQNSQLGGRGSHRGLCRCQCFVKIKNPQECAA